MKNHEWNLVDIPTLVTNSSDHQGVLEHRDIWDLFFNLLVFILTISKEFTERIAMGRKI